MRALVAVAEAGTLSGAAERLRVAQPALTKRVQRLERALGVALLERRARGVRLTDAGRAFVAGARDTLARAAAAADAARRAADGGVGRLTVGYTDLVIHSGHLPAIVGAFRACYPGVDLALAPYRVPGPALDAFEADALDVVLAHRWAEPGEVTAAGGADGGSGSGNSSSTGAVQPASSVGPAQAGPIPPGPVRSGPDGRRTRVLASCGFVAYVPAGHRLAGARSLRTRDLAGEPFVGYPPAADRAYSDGFRRACADAGLRPRFVQEVADLAAVFGLVAAGVGVKLGPAAYASTTPPGVACVPVSDFPLRLAYELAWREAPGARLAANFARVAASTDALGAPRVSPPAGAGAPGRADGLTG